jgi:PAS domain S-box-containing protein
MMLTHPGITPHVTFVSKIACWIAMCMGACAFMGWIFDAVTLTSMLPSLVSMKPNAALAIMLCGVALRFVQDDVQSVRARHIMALCAAVTVSIGLLTIVAYAFNWESRLDQWWFLDNMHGAATATSMRMGFNTALCLVAFGVALFMLDHRVLSHYPTQVLTIMATGGACAALIGYAYRIESLYGIASYPPMALPTAIALIVIGVGIVCARPDRGWMALLLRDSMGSQVARRLLPAAILVPFVNGFLELRGERLGLYDKAFGSALVATSGIMVFGTLIWWTAASLNRVDGRRRAAERKLELYRQIFVHSNDSIAVIDPRGHYLEQNLQHERLLGYMSDELIGRTPALLLGEAECSRAVDELNRTGSYRHELLCKTKSGKQISIDISVFSVRDEEGEVVCYVGMKRDITDRKQLEQIQRERHNELERRVVERTSALMEANSALNMEIAERRRAEEAFRESEGRVRVIFNHASVGIAEVRPDGRFLRVNATLCDILGRQEDVLLKMTFQELTHPDDLPENLECLQHTLAGRRDSCSIEKRYLRSDGTDVWCRLSVSLVRTSAGGPDHFISVVEDISERKRTTDALRTIVAATASVTDQDFFRSFVSHLSPAMGVRYAFVGELLEGKIELVRTLAVWTGNEYGENMSYEIHGTPCERVLREGVPCFCPQGVQQQFPTDAFLATIGAESYHGLPLLDRGGRVLGLLAVLHDQPFSLLPGMEEMLIVCAARAGVELERKRTLGELRFSDQALRQLIDEREQLAQDLHDGIIQSIYAAGLGCEEARRLVEEHSPTAVAQIQMVVGDLNSLIEDVRNHIVRKPREIKNGHQLKLALERLVRVLHTCPTIRIVTVIEQAAADRLLPAEATHVYYIAAEALSNAVRHAQAQKCLLALRLVKGAVRLEVSDNGCGFDPSISTHDGHGLRNLSGRAAKLGTELRLESSAWGGTRLIVDLPKEPRDVHTETRPYPTADCRRP